MQCMQKLGPLDKLFYWVENENEKSWKRHLVYLVNKTFSPDLGNVTFMGEADTYGAC